MQIKLVCNLNFLLIFGTYLFINGCATTSKATVEKNEAAKSFEVPGGKGSVYLYRVGKMYASAISYNVKVNGIDAGGTGPNTFFKWDLKPGTYTFLSASDESSAVMELDVKAGQIYFIRQDIRVGVSSSRILLKEVDSAVGKKEVQQAKLLVSSYIPEQ